jgi:NADH:ubiquinone oxidoreductase subunit 4 (subunit M)
LWLFLANQFVAEGSLAPMGVQTASIFSIAKRSLSVAVLVMVVAGIVFRIAQAVSKRA